MIRSYHFHLFLILLLFWAPAFGAEVQGDLVVEVLRADNDQPISGATIRVQDKAGQRAVLEGTTDATGKARIGGLPLGDYYVEISHPQYAGDRSIVKVNAGADTLYRTLLDAAGEGKVIKFKEDRLWVNAKDPNDAAVTRRDREFVQNQLADRSLQGVVATVPGVNINSVGQIHVRGDHKSATFSLDGVTLPIPPASSTTPPIDPDFLDVLEARTGSYNGSQAGQAGLILSGVTTWSKDPFFELRPRFGTQGTAEMMVRAGGSNDDDTFNFFVGAKTGTTNLQFEPPNPDFQTLNNRGQNTNVLVRMRGKTEDDEFGATFSHQTGLYGVPQTPGNFLAGVRQDQEDTNTLGLFSWKRKVDEDSDLMMSMSVLRTRTAVNNNGVFTPFTVFDAGVSEELAEEGLPADPLNPGAPYLPTALTEITQFQPSARYVRRLGENHRVTVGFDANFIRSRQRLNILDLGGGGGLPDGLPQFQANVDRDGFIGGVFFSHTVPMSEQITANYGARYDRFNNGLGVDTDQVSPFVNLAFAPSQDDSIRLSYNRVFQAPPLELDVTFQSNALPQLISLYELSYERQFGNDLTGKLAFVHKDYRDQVDIAQLIPIANIPIYAPVNFNRAVYDGIELSFASHNKTGLNGFLTGTLSWARPLEASLFTPELPQYNDHDQRVQVTGGVSHTWDNGLTAAADFFYGSGYPQAALGLYRSAGVFPYGYDVERVPRLLTNFSLNYWPKKQEGDAVEVGASLQVLNAFDQRPLLNFFSEFSGTRFTMGRRIFLSGMFRF